MLASPRGRRTEPGERLLLQPTDSVTDELMDEDLGDARNPFLLLKESIGSLMFLWCRLDNALSDALVRISGDACRLASLSFHEKLLRLHHMAEDLRSTECEEANGRTDLLARLDYARRQRNLIVHSLSGVCADPSKGEPHLLCQIPGGISQKSMRITLRQLTALLEDMNRCVRRLEDLRMLTRAELRPSSRRGPSSPLGVVDPEK